MNCPWRVEAMLHSGKTTYSAWTKCDEKECPMWGNKAVPVKDLAGHVVETVIIGCRRKRQ